jgi:hypothetical protein
MEGELFRSKPASLSWRNSVALQAIIHLSDRLLRPVFAVPCHADRLIAPRKVKERNMVSNKCLFQADTGLGGSLQEPLLDNLHDVQDDVELNAPYDAEHENRIGRCDCFEEDGDGDADGAPLFGWLDHFCYLIFTPLLFLLHFHNMSTRKCETDWEDHSFFCTLHNMTGYGWSNCIPMSVVFFVLSVYMYKISLYEVAPWMFFRAAADEGRRSTSLNCCLEAIYQGLVSLPEIMLVVMFGCILADSVENCLLTMLFTTSGFSLFTILVTTNLVVSRSHS